MICYKQSCNQKTFFPDNSLWPSILSNPACENISIANHHVLPPSQLENLISNCNNIKMEIVRKKNCFEFNTLSIQGLQK